MSVRPRPDAFSASSAGLTSLSNNEEGVVDDANPEHLTAELAGTLLSARQALIDAMGPVSSHAVSLHQEVKSSSDVTSSIQTIMNEMRVFIKQELQKLQSSLSLEVKTARESLEQMLVKVEKEEESILKEEEEILKEEHELEAELIGKVNDLESKVEDEPAHRLNLSEALALNGQEVKESSARQIELWNEFQDAITRVDNSKNVYNDALKRNTSERATSWWSIEIGKKEHSIWHHLFAHAGCPTLLLEDMPSNPLAQITENYLFVGCQMALILINVVMAGCEVDFVIKHVLSDKRDKVPEFFQVSNTVFNILFAVELLFRILALRSWFFIAPHEWPWNWFDVIIVASSVASDILVNYPNLTWMRAFRIVRAIRVARIVKVLRFFHELRKILFAIAACLRPLFWCMLFVAMVMYMFTILFLEGIVHFLDEDLDPNSAEYHRACESTRIMFPSLAGSMFSLTAAVTGGRDWVDIQEVLELAGNFYAVAFVVYVVFIVVGVMNVMTGVFLAGSNNSLDHALIIEREKARVETFVEQMLDLFQEIDISHTGAMDLNTFSAAMQNENVQAFLAAHDFEPSHARLIFDLLDEAGDGKLDVNDFVMGMVRLKGPAKAIDARIIQRELGLLPLLFHLQFEEAQTAQQTAKHKKGRGRLPQTAGI